MANNFYIARKPCGCTVAACVDEPEYRKENAKTIAEWIKKGYEVLRFSEGEFKLNRCQCEVVNGK